MSELFRRVTAALRGTVGQCGTRGLFSLRRQLEQYDRDGSGNLDPLELHEALNGFKLDVSPSDVDVLFAELDANGDGTLDFMELLEVLGPRLNRARADAVSQAFDIVRASQRGNRALARAPSEHFRGAYSAAQHPDVLRGTLSEQAAQMEFLDTFNEFFPLGSDLNERELQEYYQVLSAGVPKDADFVALISGVWGLPTRAPPPVKAAAARGRSPAAVARAASPWRAGGAAGGRRDSTSQLHRDGSVQFEVPRGGAVGFTLDDDMTATTIHPGSVAADSGMRKGMRLTQFQMEAVDTSGGTSGRQMMRIVRDEPQPWVFTFAPASAPWGASEPAAASPSSAGDGRPATVEQLMARIKLVLEKRGADSIAGLGRSFRIMDDDGSGDLNEAEFCKAMSYKGIELAPAEVSTIFGRYDADGSGGIGYEEFIRALRGTMNAKRKDVCRLAFGRFDRDGSGEITVDDMVGVFSAQKHPDVIAGRKTERDVLRMKLAQFDKVGAGGQAGDGRVTMPEFLEYYALHVSPSIDNDEHFCLLVRKAWGLDDGEVAGQRSARGRPDIATTGVNPISGRNLTAETRRSTQRGGGGGGGGEAAMAGSHFSSAASSSSSSSSSSKIKKDNAMVQKLRALPQLQPDKLSELRPFLVANDRDSSGTLSKDEFARALREFGVRLSQGELRQLFVVFDADGSGEISYEEFERAISGEASFTPARVSVVDSAFRRFDSGGDGMALLAELEASFQVASHPSVRAGQQSESACRREFVRSVDCSGGGARGTVSQHAFRRYFAQLSDGIEDDEYFEEMVHTMWFGAAAVAPGVHATPGGGGGGRQTAGSPRSPPRTTRGKSPWRSRPF